MAAIKKLRKLYQFPAKHLAKPNLNVITSCITIGYIVFASKCLCLILPIILLPLPLSLCRRHSVDEYEYTKRNETKRSVNRGGAIKRNREVCVCVCVYSLKEGASFTILTRIVRGAAIPHSPPDKRNFIIHTLPPLLASSRKSTFILGAPLLRPHPPSRDKEFR